MLILEYLEPRCLLSRLPPSIFAFDYSRDTSGLFADAQRKQAVELAGIALSARVRPHLEAIVPDATHHWTGYAANPSTGQRMLVQDLTVPANKIVVFVGARDMPDSAFASESPAVPVPADGSESDWASAVKSRGVPWTVGTPARHPDPWGPALGTIAFSTTVAWDDGTGHLSTPSRPLPGFVAGRYPQLDILGTAEHELGHVLGIGTSAPWFWLAAGGVFHGPQAEVAFGGPIPVDQGPTHWANGVRSEGTLAAMDGPSVTGRRFTDLDFAALADLGWHVTGMP